MSYWHRIDNYQRIRQAPQSAPTEPVTLAQAKEQLRLESSFTLDDSLIQAMITAARTWCEDYCNRFFVDTPLLMTADEIPPNDEPLYLPVPDLNSVENNFSYVDADGDTQTFAGTLTLDAAFQTVRPSIDWPEGTQAKITAEAGVVENITPVEQAILLLVADMYEHRTATIVGTIVADNPALKMLLAPYRAELSV